MIGGEHQEQVVPGRGGAQALYEISQAVIQIGKGIEHLVIKFSSGNVPWLMAGQGAIAIEEGQAGAGAFLNVLEKGLESNVIAHSPLGAVALG